MGGEKDKQKRLERPKGGNDPSQLAEGWPTEATLTPSFGEGASEFPQVRSTLQLNALSMAEAWYHAVMAGYFQSPLRTNPAQ